ncbi:MAG: Gldg family protein [Promethearchaeota archaeon]
MPQSDENLLFYIAFDESHKPRGRITGNYSELKDFLESEKSFICHSFMEFPITRQNLASYDILVIPCPDSSKYSKEEIENIEKWVKEDGGGLVMLSHAGGDKGRRSNLSELSEKFGISFENDQVLDKKNNFNNLENLPKLGTSNFNPPHPITENIKSLCFRAGCSLSAFGAVPVIVSSEDAEPFSSPLVVATEINEGKVVGIGSYEIFRNEIMGGFKTPGHTQFAANLFDWVETQYRLKIKSGEVQPKVEFNIPNANKEKEQILGSLEDPAEKSLGEQNIFRAFNIESTVKISDKSELADLLYILLNEAEILKQQIKNIISNVIASEEQIIGMQPEEDEQIEVLNGEEMPSDSEKKKEITEKIKAEEEKNNYQEKKTQSAEEQEPKISVEDAQAEIEILQSKITSLHELKTLVENKFQAEEYTESQKDKQLKRLERDEKKTIKRTEELKLLLKNIKK